MFVAGFDKVAMSVGRAASYAAKAVRNPSVLRNAAVGAAGGALTGAVNNDGDRLGGAIRGAAIGGVGAGLGTAAAQGYKKMGRLPGVQASLAKK